MRKVYFDDLFIIMSNDGFELCEHVPFEQHAGLLVVSLDQEYETPNHLICSIINSDEFKSLNMQVIGIPHRLMK